MSISKLYSALSRGVCRTWSCWICTVPHCARRGHVGHSILVQNWLGVFPSIREKKGWGWWREFWTLPNCKIGTKSRMTFVYFNYQHCGGLSCTTSCVVIKVNVSNHIVPTIVVKVTQWADTKINQHVCLMNHCLLEIVTVKFTLLSVLSNMDIVFTCIMLIF
jgi:hypothetical protein